MIKGIAISVLLILQIQMLCISQNASDIDSLKLQLDHKMSDSARVNLLNKIASDLFFVQPDEIENYANEALTIANNINYRKGIAEAYNNLGIFYRTKGIYNEAIDYFFNSLAIMEDEHDMNGIARSYNLIGIIHYYLGNYDLSLDYYLKALKINREQNDVKWIAGNSNNVGMIYELKGDYDDALKYYLLSLDMNTALGNENWIANNLGNIGSLYLKMDNPQSLDYFQNRLALIKKLGDLEGISRSNYLIGTFYLKQKNYKKAIGYFEQGFRYANETGSLLNLRNNSDLLSEAYAKLNNYKEAYYYNKLFKKYSDSLDFQESNQKITKLQMQNEFRKEQQLTKLQIQQSKMKHILVSIGLLLLVLVTIFLIYQQRIAAKQNKHKQRKLELSNLLLIDELKFKKNMMEDNINYMLSKNDIITSTIERLNQLKQSVKPENQKIINEVILELKSGINDNLWEEFDLRFKQVNNDFYNKLNEQFPGLTANEIKLCAFLKLNLKSKDIAAITKQSIKSVETARSRLRKKLNISKSNITLTQFLSKY